MYLSVITLYVNVLNSPLKRHKVAEWIKNKKIKYVYFYTYIKQYII